MTIYEAGLMSRKNKMEAYSQWAQTASTQEVEASPMHKCLLGSDGVRGQRGGHVTDPSPGKRIILKIPNMGTQS